MRTLPVHGMLATLLLSSALAVPALAQVPGRAPRALAATKPLPSAADADVIVAVVNGDIVTNRDVNARERLFALSSGLPVTPEVLGRLGPQVTRQLVDEKLRMQEIHRRKVVVRDKEVAEAIAEIEKRNNLPPGTLGHRLEAEGVTMRTLIDEVRSQIGWTRVLRDELGSKAEITDAEIAERTRLLKAQTGQPEYQVSEIFIPVDEPSHSADAQRFADTVITQLRAGAPFAVAAAQFSQSQNALQGGDMGWVGANELDPEVARIVAQMPEGAISNPIQVPGGYVIVTLRGKREIGRDIATMLSLRQAFVPFATPLNPAAPTEQQRQALAKAKQISDTTKSCQALEAANAALGNVRPADPGDVRLEEVTPPQFRALLASLPIGKASTPLVTSAGVAVVMVCTRDQKNTAEPNRQDMSEQLLSERIELASRQLLRDLRRHASIEHRAGAS
jgi:peptidyl-prolyl cis-trans isomerase SurA